MSAVRQEGLHRQYVFLIECELVGALAAGTASAGLLVVRHGFEQCVCSAGDGFERRCLGLGRDGGVDGFLKVAAPTRIDATRGVVAPPCGSSYGIFGLLTASVSGADRHCASLKT
jgi:hypothetical protein